MWILANILTKRRKFKFRVLINHKTIITQLLALHLKIHRCEGNYLTQHNIWKEKGEVLNHTEKLVPSTEKHESVHEYNAPG